ncbi:uncharacterized protein LOC124163380 isoform X2 [Ischnura elegans]|nr:uncharacterized protein LOC124163380 isoform X2 [Ischnura elegans]
MNQHSMRAYFLGLLMIITIETSCCIEDGIPEADHGHDSLEYYQNDNVSYQKLTVNRLEDVSCYERKEKAIPLKNRDDLEADKRTIAIDMPAEYVVIRSSKKQCRSEKDCEKLMQLMKKRASITGCPLKENLYVGEDGYVYEGRGWNVAPYWHLNGLRNKAITVEFFGDYTKTSPLPEVIEAFRTTMKIGEWTGKISKSYKITSMMKLFNDSSYVGKKLEEELANWENWANTKYLSSLWNYMIPSRLTFVFRDQWNASRPKTSSVQLTRPVQTSYIMISDGGERCQHRLQCSNWMKNEQMKYLEDYGDLLDNFYVADDGQVFEGRGWDKVPHWDFPKLSKGLLSIRIIGSHESRLPSEKAINSLKQLVQTGVWLGKVSKDYQLFSLRHVYGRNSTGETLHREIEEWTSHWEPGKPIRHISPIMETSRWSAQFSTDVPKAYHYVIVYDGGARCFSRVECTAILEKVHQKSTLDLDLRDNFYIGEDGIIYEGMGWNKLAAWRSVFVGMAFVTVKFMGTFLEEEPKWLGSAAFNTLLETGVTTGRLSPDYRVITLRRTHYFKSNQLNETSLAQLFPDNRLESRLRDMTPWSDSINGGINSSFPMYRNLIVPAAAWFFGPKSQYPRLRQPIEYVIVGNSNFPWSSRESCLRELKSVNNYRASKGLEGILYNFYITADGWVIEGRGWNRSSELNSKGSEHNYLFVMFLGNHPTSLAIYGFEDLILSGVNSGILASNFKIASIDTIFPKLTGMSPDSEQFEDFHAWGRWCESVPYSAGKSDSPSGKDILVSSRLWSATDWKPRSLMNNPVRRVLVMSVGSRCFVRENCTMIMRAEEDSSTHSDGFVTDNFYIGEDGHVYEGRGWNSPPLRSWVRDMDAITVAFLGDFEKDIPAPEALFAFQYLMKMGSYLDRIVVSYRVETVRGSCVTGVSLGEALDKEIRSWDMWAPSAVSDCSVSY